nr:hypothetical protein [Methanobacterium formicicum]
MRAFLAVDVDSTLNYEIQKVQKELKKNCRPIEDGGAGEPAFHLQIFLEKSPLPRLKT